MMLAGAPRTVQLRKKKGSRSVRIEVASPHLITVTVPWHCTNNEAL